MQFLKEEYEEKESVIGVNWKFCYLGYEVMPNSYPRDIIFSLHLTSIKDYYIVKNVVKWTDL